MKRFALFSGGYDLMMGGVKHLKKSFHTEAEAKQEAEEIAKSDPFAYWVQILDKKTDAAKIFSIVKGKLKRRKDKEGNCELEAKAAV
ncbi:hypothetical protein [Microbulbifer variabilis]|uniref:hypothetical protein n=1 Tax=Microbulbifer variabilis TaxID=266805 RepID=UPI00036F81D9|nr:hypothetical protein [Microbulbifer variabilis]